MSLFQNSVLKKYLASQNSVQIQQAFENYSAYFFNPVIRENIRNAKEEQFQEGFLDQLKKLKVKLSLFEEAESITYFNEQKEKAISLQTEIDQMVYELYVLTEEEIRIVEGGE